MYEITVELKYIYLWKSCKVPNWPLEDILSSFLQIFEPRILREQLPGCELSRDRGDPEAEEDPDTRIRVSNRLATEPILPGILDLIMLKKYNIFRNFLFLINSIYCTDLDTV